jgi:cell filamentation protein
MSNSYNYIDPDFNYTDPKTGLLRNLQDITDHDVLLFVESGAVIKRLQELYEHPLKIKGSDSLFEIHKHLFQDIYVWAGKKRTVEISKDGKQFFPTSHFDNAFRYIDQLISDFKKIPKDNKKILAAKSGYRCIDRIPGSRHNRDNAFITLQRFFVRGQHALSCKLRFYHRGRIG